MRIAIPVAFALREQYSGISGHDLASVFSSTLVLHHYFGFLLRAMDGTGITRSPLVDSDGIGGVSFSDLVLYIRDMARNLGAVPHMEPLQCYQIEVLQLKTLASAVVAMGEESEVSRSPAMIDAFASNRILTYTAALCRDPRADLARHTPPEENIFPIETVGWEELVIPTWSRLISSAFLCGNSQLAAEFVDSNFLFLLEGWTLKQDQPVNGA